MAKTYRGKEIEVTFDLETCIHAAECLRGLPDVFDTDQRPWIQPDRASAQAVRDVVARCPSGALGVQAAAQEQEKDVSDSPAPDQNPAVSLSIKPNGPILVTGPCVMTGPDGAPIPLERSTFALCRCGNSATKPFCDGAHSRGEWTAGD